MYSQNYNLLFVFLYRHECINVNVDEENIIYFYGESQPLINQLKERHPKINLTNDIIKCKELLDGNNSPKILVLDDLLSSICNDKHMNTFVSEIFTQKSHHSNIGCILISQNLFPVNCRLISLNATYIIILRQIRDKMSFRVSILLINI